MDSLSINIPADKAKVLLLILEIAHKTHKNNPSPVDIKLELAAIDEGDIIELKHKFSELLS